MSTLSEVANVARSLRILEGLIKEQFDGAERAAADATEPYYRTAAPLLVEAKEGHFVGNADGFYNWAQKKFGKSRTQISTWLSSAQALTDKSFKSLHEIRYAPKVQGGRGHKPPSARTRPWTQPVDEVAERARREAFRLVQDEALSRFEERKAEHQLAGRLVDIGYRVLAKELHPDKMGGDKSAFQRLSRVRHKLKHSI